MAKKIMDTKQLRDINTSDESYVVYQDYEVNMIIGDYPRGGVIGLSKDSIEGVIIKLYEGEIEEMWVTDSQLTYDLSTTYYRVK